jgi:hypothetical protein
MLVVGGERLELPAQLFTEIAGYTQVSVDGRQRERRKYARTPFTYRAMVIRIANGAAEKPAEARIRDICPGGIGILYHQSAKDGEELYVRLPRRRGESTWVGGVVVHCRLVERGLYRIGLRFSRLIGLKPHTQAAACA